MNDDDDATEFDELLRAQEEFMKSGLPPAARLTSKPRPKKKAQLSAAEQRNLLYSRVEREEGGHEVRAHSRIRGIRVGVGVGIGLGIGIYHIGIYHVSYTHSAHAFFQTLATTTTTTTTTTAAA